MTCVLGALGRDITSDRDNRLNSIAVGPNNYSFEDFLCFRNCGGTLTVHVYKALTLKYIKPDFSTPKIV